MESFDSSIISLIQKAQRQQEQTEQELQTVARELREEQERNKEKTDELTACKRQVDSEQGQMFGDGSPFAPIISGAPAEQIDQLIQRLEYARHPSSNQHIVQLRM